MATKRKAKEEAQEPDIYRQGYYRAYFYGNEMRGVRSGIRTVFLAHASRHAVHLIFPFLKRHKRRLSKKKWAEVKPVPYKPNRSEMALFLADAVSRQTSRIMLKPAYTTDGTEARGVGDGSSS